MPQENTPSAPKGAFAKEQARRQDALQTYLKSKGAAQPVEGAPEAEVAPEPEPTIITHHRSAAKKKEGGD